MTDRAERRRQMRAARKDDRRSPFVDYPAEGTPPLRGSALVRARELFAQACETDGHPCAGMSVTDIRDIERERRPVPNRAMARRYGIRSSYTAQMHKRLVATREFRLIEALLEDDARVEAHRARRQATIDRATRRAERHAAFRQRVQDRMAAEFEAAA